MDSLLPLGSVVQLKNRKNLVTIMGFLHFEEDDEKSYVVEYVGVDSVEGLKKKVNIVYFDEEDIENIYYIGYALEFDLEFLKAMHQCYIEIVSGKSLDDAISDIAKSKYKFTDEKLDAAIDNVIDSYFSDVSSEKAENKEV